MDNTAAVAYINKMGGTQSQVLSNLALDLWEWCIHHQMEVSAQHLPGHLNTRADRESRQLPDSSDWKLNPEMFQALAERWGPLEIDLFASRLSHQLPTFVSWRPDPLAVHSDAFSLSWQSMKGYAFPPFALIGQMSAANVNPESGAINTGSASMASSAMVPTTAPALHRHPSALSDVPSTSDEGQSITPTNQSTTGWVETISQHYKAADISEATRNLLLAAWRKNTTSTYSSAWNRWVSWCNQRQVNPLSAHLSAILEFLKDQFEDGKAYGTLNVYRSALSTLLPAIDTVKVGSHPLVSQPLKGVFNLRPPEPKYLCTWDVSRVLDFIKSLGPNEALDLKISLINHANPLWPN